MNKLIITSDTHFDNLSMFSTVTAEGYNSRFIANLSAFKGILDYAREHECKLLHLGDLFNRRLLIPADIYHLVYKLLAEYSDVIQYYLVGNHDMYGDSPKNTILKPFSEMRHINIIDKPAEVYFQPNTHIFFIPYGAPLRASSAAKQNGAFQILVMHLGIKDAKIGSREYRMESDISIPQVRELGYDLTLVGHIHKPQALTDNIIIVGSPYQLSFAEVDEEKYFYVFDCEEKKLVKYPTNAPKFLVHEIWSEEDFCELPLDDGNYHRVNILTDAITFQDIKAYTSPNVIISFTKQAQYKPAEVEVPKGRNTKDEVEDYYNNLETDLKKDKLKGISLSITKD